MPDREKVIKGLEHCSEDGCEGCPYEPECLMADGFSELARDALELLKEQEPVYPNLKQTFEAIHFTCGNCGMDLMKGKYCPECGRKVKWDD